MLFRSHRGGVYYAPENTIPAFRSALSLGYDQIETDPQLTKDGEIILLHDSTLNRTCRLPDGSPLTETMYACDMTYDEISRFDAGIFKGEQFKGTRVPKLSELLELMDGSGILLDLDKRISTDNLEVLTDLVKKYNVPIEFSCKDIERIKRVLELMPNAFINYDGVNTEEALKEIREIVPREKLSVWVYLDKPNFAWLTDRDKASQKVCTRVKKYASLGIANINCAEDVYEAIMFNPDIVEV